jgi:signal transduction histidine kinase
MESLGHHSWISSTSVRDNWHPAYYAPRFRELEDVLSGQRQSLVPLGEYIELTGGITPQPKPHGNEQWIVRSNARMVEAVFGVSGDVPESAVAIPDRSLVVSRTRQPGNAFQPALYWEQSIFRVDGVASSAALVFQAKGISPIAWIQEALRTDLCTQQLDRLLIGVENPLIEAAWLLDILVERSSQEDLRRRSEQVIADLRRRVAFNSRRVVVSAELGLQPFLLTAATFKERLDQFETYLCKQLPEDRRLFFVEASTTEPDSDLFVVRQVGAPFHEHMDEGEWRLRDDKDSPANSRWRSWYWDTKGGSFKLFNSLLCQDDLPEHMLARITARPTWLGLPDQRLTLPAFGAFRDVLEPRRQEGLGESEAAEQLIGLWHALNATTPPSDELLRWLSQVFRPVVAIRVTREGEPAGAYLLFGADQVGDPYAAAAELESYGNYLGETLNRSTEVLDESARSESLRRLSWIMHQIASPVSRLRNGISDMQDFLSRHPEFAGSLLPDDVRAKARAEMRGAPLSDFTVEAKILGMEDAAMELNRLRYQVRRFKNAHRPPQLTSTSLTALLERVARDVHEQMPHIQITCRAADQDYCNLDYEMIHAALDEVVHNSLREFAERNTEAPCLRLLGERRGHWTVLKIIDNALPVEVTLPGDVFDEGTTTYATKNKGSGLGLAIVRTSFLQHGGRCYLDANHDDLGQRLPGVTFTAELPASEEEHAHG